ncbi:Sterol metabolism-related protein [Mycena indigotica]|uniref:Sterol metabolism-related protein n=1 Tax=Mycena indigotica TaxID=2126181 RepID=A0A8H6W4L5_9AGAR|nr:Sterol metabolism-related protein [Mycena indigotica]KAF7301593.1 Sterol metabolism-related protein [Mycena indigotica]
MSWMSGLTGQEPERYVVPESEPKVADPHIPDRMVSAKKANQPFLAYKEYREQQERLHQEWLEKKKIRDDKIARGEPVGPLPPDPTQPVEVGLVGLLKFLLYVLVGGALLGKFITGSYTWEYETQFDKLKQFWPTDQRLFSERLLSEYTGQYGKPTYLAIDGDVYDVSKGKAYQPGGSYHFMTGIDAARAFGTGCFETHRTHDLRGLSYKEWEGVLHWKQFFAKHKDYPKVGRVSHRPIDPASPIPDHCDPSKQEQSLREGAEREEAQRRAARRASGRDEL